MFLSFRYMPAQLSPSIFFRYSCFIMLILSSHSTIFYSGSLFLPNFLPFSSEVKCFRRSEILLFCIFLRSASRRSSWL